MLFHKQEGWMIFECLLCCLGMFDTQQGVKSSPTCKKKEKKRKRIPPRRTCILCDYVLKRESLTWCLLSASGDELLLTEMIFNGLFNDLTVEQATALLSCFVFQENVRTHNTAQHTHKHTLEIPLNSQKQTDTSSSERRHKTDDSRFPHIFRPPRSHSWARLPN